MSNIRRLPTPDNDLERVLAASIARAKRPNREATLTYVTGLRKEAERQYRANGQTRDDASTLITSLEIENCALRALLDVD